MSDVLSDELSTLRGKAEMYRLDAVYLLEKAIQDRKERVAQEAKLLSFDFWTAQGFSDSSAQTIVNILKAGK